MSQKAKPPLTPAKAPDESRRLALGTTARWGLVAALAALTGALAWKRKSAAPLADCRGEGPCGICPALFDCQEDRARGTQKTLERRFPRGKGRV